MYFGSRAHAYICASAIDTYISTGYEYPTLRPFEATKEQCKDKRQLHVPGAFCPASSSTSSLDPNRTSYSNREVDTGGARSVSVEVPAQGCRDTPQLVQGEREFALAPDSERGTASGEYNGQFGGPGAEARSARAKTQGLHPSADSQGAVGRGRSPGNGPYLGVPGVAAPRHLGTQVAVGPHGDGGRRLQRGQPLAWK